MFKYLLLIVTTICLSACNTRPDYSSLKVTPRTHVTKTGDTCSALGRGFNFYRYTCTGWTAPAERCLKTDAEADALIEKISYDTGRACRLMEVIRAAKK